MEKRSRIRQVAARHRVWLLLVILAMLIVIGVMVLKGVGDGGNGQPGQRDVVRSNASLIIMIMAFIGVVTVLALVGVVLGTLEGLGGPHTTGTPADILGAAQG